MICRGYASNGMQVPAWLQEEMWKIDPDLSMFWNRVACLWQIRKLDTFTRRPEIVLTIRGEDGGYRPLDRRIILELNEADVYRRFNGRQEKYMGALIEQDLKRKQEKYDKEKKKAADEQHGEAREQLVSALKKVDL